VTATTAEIAAVRERILTGASRRVPAAAMASQARALGLWRNGGVRAGGDGQFLLCMDLAVFSPVGGHRPAIEREAKARPREAGSLEAAVLAGLEAARFALFRLGASVPERGRVACEDLLTGEAFTLVDGRLSQPGLEGVGVAGRLMEMDGERLTCGVCAPLTDAVIETLLGRPAAVAPMPEVLPPLAPLAEADRLALQARAAWQDFPQRVYAAVLDHNVMGPRPA
jgi:hypothetical protein